MKKKLINVPAKNKSFHEIGYSFYVTPDIGNGDIMSDECFEKFANDLQKAANKGKLPDPNDVIAKNKYIDFKIGLNDE